MKEIMIMTPNNKMIILAAILISLQVTMSFPLESSAPGGKNSKSQEMMPLVSQTTNSKFDLSPLSAFPSYQHKINQRSTNDLLEETSSEMSQWEQGQRSPRFLARMRPIWKLEGEKEEEEENEEKKDERSDLREEERQERMKDEEERLEEEKREERRREKIRGFMIANPIASKRALSLFAHWRPPGAAAAASSALRPDSDSIFDLISDPKRPRPALRWG